MEQPKVSYSELLGQLAVDQLGALEEAVRVRIDELSDEIGFLFSQIEEIWSEYSWYDSETGDYNLKGNAYYYEENLQAEMNILEEKLGYAERQLVDIEKRLREVNG